MGTDIPFWEDPRNQNLIKDPQIIRGMNLIWWFFILNAIGREIRNRIRADVQGKFDSFKIAFQNWPGIQNSGLWKDCESFLAEEFSQEFWS